MRYQVLGQVTAVAGDTAASLGGAKQRLALVLLLVDVGRVVSDDRLIAALWGNHPSPTARHTLRTYISGLRGALDDQIVRSAGGYRLVADPDSVDMRRFERLLAAGIERLSDAPSSAGQLLREALALWRGEPFGDLATSPALQPEVHHLREARLTAVERRIEADVACGIFEAVVLELDALVREHPYRERLRELQVLALYRSGRQADALAAYERARRELRDDLGIDPSPALRALHGAVLRQDPALLAATSAAADEQEAAAAPVVPGFEMRALVWTGPVSRVYRAYQAASSREVALKLIAPPVASAPAFIQLFEPWAAAVGRVEHPHLVPLLDAWREPDGARLVSPWIAGGSLASALRTGPWPVDRTVHVVHQVGAALSALHDHGLVHGAVAARHVLFDREGRALLGDVAPPPAAGGAGGRTAENAGSGPAEDVRDLALLAIELLTGIRPDPRDPLRLLAQRSDVPVEVVDVLGSATGWTAGKPSIDAGRLVEDLSRAAGAPVRLQLGPSSSEHRPRNPYKGLRAFDERDADDFFGREELVAQLVDVVGRNRLVTVVGPSGSGKSSVVRAGLLPALRRGAIDGSERWFVVGLVPGAHPFDELARALERVAVAPGQVRAEDMRADDRGILRATTLALPSANAELVLVVDQLEELFTLTADDDARRRFLDGLAVLATSPESRTRVVCTLRADYFDRPLDHPVFGPLLRRGLVAVAVLSSEELAQCVEEPARRVGIAFQQGLVPRIVADVGSQPGALPLLQHTLTELFALRDGRVLTAAGYAEIGGVTGAVGRRAELLYRELSPPARKAAPSVLLRLVKVTPAGEAARLRVLRSVLRTLSVGTAAVDEVLETFGAGRLLSFDRDAASHGPTVELAHEAVFSSWPRLAGWIADRRAGLAEHQRLVAAFDEWTSSGQDDGALLAPSRLVRFERLEADGAVVLTADERRFLDHSRRAANRRRSRRLRITAGVLAFVTLLVGAGGLLAAYGAGERARADASERVAAARRLASDSRRQRAVDHDLAVLLALRSVAATRIAGDPAIPEAVDALHEAVAAHRTVALIEEGGMGVALLERSRRLLTSGPPSFTPRIHDWAGPPQPPTSLAGAGSAPVPVPVASPDGRFLAESYEDAPAVVWSAQTGEVVATLDDVGSPTRSPTFSADGQLLAVLVDVVADSPRRAGRTVVVWDVAAGVERGRIELGAPASAIALSPDGSQVAVLEDGRVVVVDAGTGREALALEDEADGIPVDVAFDPTGDGLAVLSTIPGRVTVHDVESGAVRLTLPSGTDTLLVCYAGDGSFIAASAADGVRVWDAARGDERLRLPAGGASRASCGAADTVAVPHGDGTVRIYDVGAGGGAEVLAAPAPPTFAAVYAPDGSIIATGRDGIVRRVDSRSGAVLAESGQLVPGPSPWLPAVSPDGRYVAVRRPPAGAAGEAGEPVVALLDAATLDEVRSLGSGGTPIGFDRAGQRLLVGGIGRAQVLDTTTGARIADLPIAAPPGNPPVVEDGALTPDGRHALLLSAVEPAVWIWDVNRRRQVVELTTTEVGGRLDLSSDGRQVALLGREGAVEVVDVPGLLGRAADPVPTVDVDEVRLSTFVAPGFTGLEVGPRGDLVATAGFDGELGVYAAATGQRAFGVRHAGFAAGAGFSPDGRHVVAAVTQDGGLHSIRAYTVDVDELVEIAESKVLRDLSDEECLRFLGEPTCPSA